MKFEIAVLVGVLSLSACSFDPGQRPHAGSDAGDASIADDVGDASDGSLPSDANRRDGSAGFDAQTTDTSVPDAGADTTSTDATTDGAGGDADATTQDMGGDASTMRDCGGMLVDVSSNPEHCGACDNACDPDFGVCQDGQCTCNAPELTACGMDNTCAVTSADSLNCGTCGHACDPGEACRMGTCQCRRGLDRCDGACVDLDSDAHHCGDCNTDCGSDACYDGQCRNDDTCPFGRAWTCSNPQGGADCIRGQSHDLNCDPNIGDSCGTQCAGNEVCYDPPPLFDGRACRAYRPGRGCTGCPCDDCTDQEYCVESDRYPDMAFCVE